jgi:hypothetical protein
MSARPSSSSRSSTNVTPAARAAAAEAALLLAQEEEQARKLESLSTAEAQLEEQLALLERTLGPLRLEADKARLLALQLNPSIQLDDGLTNGHGYSEPDRGRAEASGPRPHADGHGHAHHDARGDGHHHHHHHRPHGHSGHLAAGAHGGYYEVAGGQPPHLWPLGASSRA